MSRSRTSDAWGKLPPVRHLPAGVVDLRVVESTDEPFLCAVYASTRREELAVLDWEPAQVDAFLTMQFNAQHQHYQIYYPDADFLVILLDGRPVGRLYVARWPAEIRIIDIALLPSYRSFGIGTALLQELMAEGDRTARPVSIHVERFNRALRLYQRLGFTLVEDKGVYLLLARQPVSGG